MQYLCCIAPWLVLYVAREIAMAARGEKESTAAALQESMAHRTAGRRVRGPDMLPPCDGGVP
jgi:hypothetical protein